MNLPRAYLEYLDGCGSAEAFLSTNPGYMVLWSADEIPLFNAEYEVAKYAPGFLCFGDNGGGELLAFDESEAVVSLPAIGMEPRYATPVADSWTEFVRLIEKAI